MRASPTVAAMPAIAKMRAVVLDCPDPRALAEFYRALVGGDVTYADDDWVNLRDGGNVLLSFQRAPDYQAPDWPSVTTLAASPKADAPLTNTVTKPR